MKRVIFILLILINFNCKAQSRLEMRLQSGNTLLADAVFSHDGKYIFAAGEQLKLWDVATGREIFTYRGALISTRALAYSPDGKYLAFSNQHYVINIWNSNEPEIAFQLKGHNDAVYSLSFSLDNKYLLSGSWDKTLIL